MQLYRYTISMYLSASSNKEHCDGQVSRVQKSRSCSSAMQRYSLTNLVGETTGKKYEDSVKVISTFQQSKAKPRDGNIMNHRNIMNQLLTFAWVKTLLVKFVIVKTVRFLTVIY